MGFQFIRQASLRMMAVPLTGIDISDRNIKFLRFESTRGTLRVAASGSVPLAAGVVVEGAIKDHAALVEALKGLGLKSRFSENLVAVSLPEEKGFVRVIQLPRAKAANLKSSLTWELEGNIPLPPEEIYFDYEVVEKSSTPDHVSIVTVAFPRVLVDGYVAAFTEAGLTPLAFEIESQSIARALVDRERLEDPVIIFDMGASRTSFVLTQDGNLVFTSTMPISGNTLNRAISEVLHVSVSEAERIKHEAGLRLDQYEGKVFEALQPALATLVEELEKHIHFYHDHLALAGQAPDIAKIICTGGEANLAGLDAYLARALHKPVAIGDPFIPLLSHMKGERPPLPKNVSLQFSTAVGLALREFDL